MEHYQHLALSVIWYICIFGCRYILHLQVLLRCCWIYMGSSQWENWNNLFCGMSSCIFDILYPKLTNEMTPFILRNLKDRARFFRFHEKSLYIFYLARIKEQVCEKRSTVGIHGNSFLKNASTKFDKWYLQSFICTLFLYIVESKETIFRIKKIWINLPSNETKVSNSNTYNNC